MIQTGGGMVIFDHCKSEMTAHATIAAPATQNMKESIAPMLGSATRRSDGIMSKSVLPNAGMVNA